MKIIKVRDINMGRIVKKVRDMNWMPKISLVLIFTLVFTMLQTLFVPEEAQADQVTFTSSGSWTPPSAQTITVECWGAGGGGGGGGGSNGNGGGGGAGGQYVRGTVAVTVQSYSYVIGAGGAGVSNANGNAGGDCVFGSNLIVAKGGAGGQWYTNGGAGGAGSTTGAVGGNQQVWAGGSGANGTAVQSGGGGGGAGSTNTGQNATGMTGGGARTENGGAGGDGCNANSCSGTAGSIYGGGGGGATKNATSSSGAGAVIRITYTPASGNLAVANGTNPANANAPRSSTNNALDGFTLAMSAGTGTVSTLTVTGSANFTATNIPTNGVKIYRDAGTVGTYEPGTDTLISSSSTAISGNATTVTLSSAESVTTTPANYLVTVDMTAGATLSQTFTGTVTAATGTTLGTPTYNDSGSATLTVTAAQTLTFGQGTDPANANAPRSSTNNALDAFTLSLNSGTGTVSTLTVTGSANFTATNIPTNGVKIYRDAGTIGTYEPGTDTLISSSSTAISGNATTVTLSSAESVTTTPANYLVTVDMTAGATLSQTFTGTISAATGSGIGTPVDNDTASATLTVSAAATLTFGQGTDPANANAPRSSMNRALDAFTLSLNSGSGTVSTLTVTGSANFNATNIPTDGVKIYRDAGTIGAFDSAGIDTLISSSSTAIAGNSTTVTLASAESVTTSVANYLVTVDINAGATLSQTFTATISAATGSGIGTPVDNDTSSATLTISAAVPPSTITSCSTCHQYTPTFADGSSRNVPVGQFVGTHNAHIQTYGYTCAVCHTTPATETGADFKHRDGNIQMASAGANYATGTSWTQTSTPSLTTCGVTVCHGTNSGTWGTDASARDACTVCHGILTTNTDGATTAINRAPGTNNTGVNTGGSTGALSGNTNTDSVIGAHNVHLQALNSYSNPIACTQCHAVPAVSVSGIKSHLDGLPANMTWGDLATLSGTVTPTYTAGGGTCTNYCHGVNLADGSPSTKTTPDWNTDLLAGTGGGDCGKCHGNPPNTGDHGGVSANVCNTCHPHVINSKTTAPFFQTSGAYSLASHINGVKDATGTCLGCHSSRQPSSGDQRAIIIGGAAGSEGGDFVRTSRHVKNTTVTNLDCVICHAEGDVSTTSTTVVKHATLHGNQVVDLRNVDSYTNSWAWPGYRLVSKTITATNRDNMDTFCMNCHDSDASSATASQGGSYSIAVNGTSTAILTGTAVARRSTPFNHLDGGSPLDARGQFNRTNLTGSNYASHHQLNQFTPRYASGYQTTSGKGLNRGGWTGTSKDGVAYNWETKLHCSDCHLNESNAHGSINTPRLLQASNGTDSTWTDADDGTGTFVCYKCHQSSIYSVSSADTTVARLSHKDLDPKPWGTGYSADARQIRCLNCHGGAGIGQIHGNNRSITTRSAGTTNSYRFMFGAELGYNLTDWTGTTQPACYTSSTTWGGSCTSHDSGTTTGRIGAPRYTRTLD